jgi:multicomponent K+:H+ antiporter subunit F
LLNIYRIVNAPTVGDRILALDTMVINAIALLALFGILEGTAVYFEASMLIAMTGFISTVSYTRYLLRGDIIE